MPRVTILPPPAWACPRWGDWEHDWLECPACLAAYDRQNDEPEP